MINNRLSYEWCKKDITKGYILALIGVLTISTDTLLIKLVDDNVDIWVLIFYRYLLYFSASFLYNLYKQKSKIFSEIYNLGYQGLLALCMLTICNICFTMSIDNIGVSSTLSIYAISPIMTSLFSWISFKQKMFIWTKLILFLVSGLIIISNIFSVRNDNIILNDIGYLYANCAMITTSIYFTLLRYNRVNNPEKKMVLVTFLSALTTTIISLMAINNYDRLHISKANLYWLIIQGILVLPISFICFTNSTKYITGSESNMILILEIVLAPVWVYLAGLESPTKVLVICLAIIVTLLLINSILSIKYTNTETDVETDVENN